MSESPKGQTPDKPPAYDWSGAPEFLQNQDETRLRNLFERTIGRGFKMAVIETPTPADRLELLDWLQPNLDAAGAVRHDVHLPELLGEPDEHGGLQTTVWQELTEKLPPGSVAGQRAVLILDGIEDLQYGDGQNRFDLLQQFNVQRDLFVRDYPCFWLLLIHPQSRHHWHRVAPDFSDFVALWAESSSQQETIPVATRSAPDVTSHSIGSIGFASEHWPEPLRAAFDEISLSQYDEALDRIHSFLAVTPETPETECDRNIARMLETDVWVDQGEPKRAMDRLRDDVLPVFERLDLALEIADTLDRIAGLRADQVELTEALEIRQKRILSLCKQNGFVRETAVTQGKIADVLQARSELDETLRIRREEQLPVYERLGDVRSKAVTQGKIADVLQDRGELDEALRIRREEQLPALRTLGAKRDVVNALIGLAKVFIARTEGADIRRAEESLNEALPLAEEMKIPQAANIKKGLKYCKQLKKQKRGRR